MNSNHDPLLEIMELSNGMAVILRSINESELYEKEGSPSFSGVSEVLGLAALRIRQLSEDMFS